MEKYIRVSMDDGSQYDIPAKFVAMNRAKYYAEKDSSKGSGYDEALVEEFNMAMNDSDELIDWASNNLNWEDVNHIAKKSSDNKDVNFQEGWTNGSKELVEY